MNAECRWRYYQKGSVEPHGWYCLQDGAGMLSQCYTPMDLVLSVVEMSVDFVLSTRSRSVSLVGMALHRVSKATENETNSTIKLSSGALVALYSDYWMLQLSGLWGYYLKPAWGDACAWGAGWK